MPNHGEPYEIYPKHSSNPNDITVFCCPSHSSFILGASFLNLTGGVLGTDGSVPLTGVGGLHLPNWMVHVTAICDVTHLLWRTLAMGFLWKKHHLHQIKWFNPSNEEKSGSSGARTKKARPCYIFWQPSRIFINLGTIVTAMQTMLMIWKEAFIAWLLPLCTKLLSFGFCMSKICV